jgi:hypothetical protein
MPIFFETPHMRKLLLTVLSSVSLASCQKKEVNPEILFKNISGNYILKALRMSATGIPEQDALPSVKECERDNLYELRTDSSFKYVDTGLVCEPSSANYEGNWMLEGNQISFYGQTGTVSKFDGNTLEVTSTSTNEVNTYVIKSTYEKKHD